MMKRAPDVFMWLHTEWPAAIFYLKKKKLQPEQEDMESETSSAPALDLLRFI